MKVGKMSTDINKDLSETGSGDPGRSLQGREESGKGSLSSQPSNAGSLDRPGELLAERIESLSRMTPPQGNGYRDLGERSQDVADVSPSAHRGAVKPAVIGVVHSSSGATSLQAPSNLPKPAASSQPVPHDAAERPLAAQASQPQPAAQTEAGGMQPPIRPPAPTIAASSGEPRPRPTPTPSQDGLPLAPPPVKHAVDLQPKPAPKIENGYSPPFDVEEFVREAEDRKRGAKVMREVKSLEQEIRAVQRRGVPCSAIHRGLKKRGLVTCSHTRFGDVCSELFPDIFGKPRSRNA